MQKEIIKIDNLLDKFGNLTQSGYSKNMLLTYNRQSIKASKLKIKEWDYYLIYNNEYAVALTVDDNSYMGLISASIINFKNATEITTSKMQAFTFGKTNLPNSSIIGDINYTTKLCSANFIINADKTRTLKLSIKNFTNKDFFNSNDISNKDFYAEFNLSDEPKESMVIATPFKKKKHFYYNQKIVGFKADGFVKVGKEKITFNKTDTHCILDWGRGVWTYKNTWYWGAACGIYNNKKIGFNIGYGFGDTSNATENMVFFEGKAHKLDIVNFNIPKKNKKDDFLSPWTFSSNDKRFEMSFEPIIDRKSKTDIGLICSDQHQVFGKFSGYFILDNGKKIEIKNFLGFAEKVFNKW